MTYGELSFIRVAGKKTYPSGQTAPLWEMLCSCGVKCVAPDRQIKSGIKQSCGHLKKRPRVKTHGGARGRGGTPEWRAWRAMRNRCNNPKDKFYHLYGGRGIKVCDRWQNSFENFLADMGEKPEPKHENERIDNDGNYEPNNCRWASRKEQANNTSHNVFLTHEGVTLTLAQWAERLGINYFTLHSRVRRRGMTLKEAFKK